MGNPLKDLGLSDGGDHMHLEHALSISLSSSLMEKQLLQALHSFSETSRETSKAIKIIGYGVAAYLLLLGGSKVIEAVQVAKIAPPKKGSSEIDARLY